MNRYVIKRQGLYVMAYAWSGGIVTSHLTDQPSKAQIFTDDSVYNHFYRGTEFNLVEVTGDLKDSYIEKEVSNENC